MTGKTIKIGALILCVAVVALLGWRFAGAARSGRTEPVDPSEGLSYLAALEAEDVAARKALIAEKRAKAQAPAPQATPTEATPTEATPTEAVPPDASGRTETPSAPAQTSPAPVPPRHIVQDGNYRRAFGNILISGDSIVKAIEEYGLLDGDQVIAKVGGGISFLKETMPDLAAAAPACLVLHYGENELDDPPRAGSFTARYAEAIRTLQELLPDTRIIVDSIFPVKAFACEAEPWLRYIDEYNAALREMCDELGVTFLDFTPLWQSFDRDYYDMDGIHPVASFYSEQYLPCVISEVENA